MAFITVRVDDEVRAMNCVLVTDPRSGQRRSERALRLYVGGEWITVPLSEVMQEDLIEFPDETCKALLLAQYLLCDFRRGWDQGSYGQGAPTAVAHAETSLRVSPLEIVAAYPSLRAAQRYETDGCFVARPAAALVAPGAYGARGDGGDDDSGSDTETEDECEGCAPRRTGGCACWAHLKRVGEAP